MGLRLYVVRHGETEWTRERRYTGWRDVALSATGSDQSRLVARALARCPVAQIYASPLARTRMSAEVIAEPHGLPVRLDPDFREMGLGEWEGLTRDEVEARDPVANARWQAEPQRFSPPGGESLAAVTERVTAAVERLRARHDGQTVVLVTHAIVIRVMMLDALGRGVERMWSIDVSPASITDLEYDRDGATIHGANMRAHLEVGAARAR